MSTGLRAGTNNDGYLQVNGTDVLTALSSGNVGIGTTTPNVALHIVSTTTGFRVQRDVNSLAINPNYGGQNHCAIEVTNALSIFPGGGTEKVRISSTGNVGIGTNNPGTKLQVFDSSATPVVRISGPSAGSSAVEFYASSTKNGALLVNSSGFLIAADNSNPITFNAGGTERLRIASTGTIGIGTNNPNSNSILDVNGVHWIVKDAQYNSESFPGLYLRSSRTSGAIGLILGTDSTTGISYIQPLQSGVTYAQNMSLCAMGGNVGIGVTNPDEKLEVNGDIKIDRNGNRWINLDSGDNTTYDSRVEASHGLTFRSYIAAGEANTKSFDFTTNGDIDLSGGRHLKFASGNGIDFSATSNTAGMTSELFNDYEEGTWTGTIFTQSIGSSVNLLDGFYVKIGRYVTATARYLYGTGFNLNDVRIDGLPFTAYASVSQAGGLLEFQDGAAVGAGIGRVNSNTTRCERWGLTNPPSTSFAGNVWFTISYKTAA